MIEYLLGKLVINIFFLI